MAGNGQITKAVGGVQVSSPAVPDAVLQALTEQAQNAGYSVDGLAAEMGLGPNVAGAGNRMSLASYLRLQSRLTLLLGDETGRFSKRQLLTGSTELALSQLPSRGTLRDAMDVVARTYNVLHGGAFNAVEERAGAIAFVVDDRDFPYAVPDGQQVFFIMETTLLFLHALLRLIVPSVAAGGWRAAELRGSQGSAVVPFERHVPVAYGCQRYALLYESAAAARSVNFPPPRLHHP